MAPELRKRKSLAETKKPNGAAKAEKPAAKGKRKAPEAASPVSLKKQKSVKKTVVDEKPVKKPAQKTKKSKVLEEKVSEEKPVEEDTIDIPDVSESEEEEESKEVQVLVTELDSGDEDVAEGDNVFQEGQDVGKIPKVSKEVQKAADSSNGEPGVIYIGRIPHGFYEHEMRSYFSQFGPINKLRLSRNKKTGASKHFAFVEFAEASTAEIVSKTMDNYLLFGHILKCRVIPKDQVHDDLFKGANRRFKKVPWNKMVGKTLEKPRTEAAWEAKVSREQSKRAKKAAKLKEIGYDFEMPDIKSVPAPAAPVTIENGENEAKAIEAAPAEKEEKTKEVEKPAEVEEAQPEVEEEAKAEVKPKKAAPKTKATKAKAGKGRGRKAKA